MLRNNDLRWLPTPSTKASGRPRCLRGPFLAAVVAAALAHFLARPAGDFALAAAERTAPAVAAALDSIEPRDVDRHIEWLAADERSGRDTPMRGLDEAAAYLAKELEAFGLQPVSEGPDPYYLPWSTRALVPGPASELTAHVPGNEQTEKTFELGVDWIPAWVSAEREVRGRVVFAGYGITARDERYDDYGGKSIHGKIAIVLSNEPRQKSKGKRFEGETGTKYSSIRSKAENAAEHGAIALIVVPNPAHHPTDAPLGDQLPRMARGGRSNVRPREPAPIPVISVRRSVAEELLGRPLAPLQKGIDRSLHNKLVSGETVELRIRVGLEESNATTQNVGALKPGSDPSLRDEIVIIGAHYDHIGVTDDTVEVNPGADDNGSGTTALLEIAQALGSSELETRRSVLVLFFSGEEKGLLGSKDYVARPRFPLEKTVAMLNLDMVGRNDPRRVEVLGHKENPRLYGIARRAAADRSVGGLRIDEGSAEFFERSDHFPFHERGIPVLFFFSGLHEDYHQPTDKPERIDRRKIVRVARTVLLTALEIAEEG